MLFHRSLATSLLQLVTSLGGVISSSSAIKYLAFILLFSVWLGRINCKDMPLFLTNAIHASHHVRKILLEPHNW